MRLRIPHQEECAAVDRLQENELRNTMMDERAQETVLLKTVELAGYLNVSTQWVQKKWNEGEIPGFRLGPSGALRFDARDIAAWLRSSAPGDCTDAGGASVFQAGEREGER